MFLKKINLLWLLYLLPLSAQAADFDATTLSLGWGLPFVGILLSIALMPLFLTNLWHHHYGKIIALWTTIFVIPFAYVFGMDTIIYLIAHATLEEYLPFILLLLALFTVSGGIVIESHHQGTPKFNLLLLIIGTGLASVMGTTGAAMLMIRPIIRANRYRQQQVHIIIFFIFLVANIGGGLTPLGDPPLFIGFLKGVSFLWTVQQMLLPVLLTSGLLLLIFYAIDRYYYIRQGGLPAAKSVAAKPVKIYGKQNSLLLLAVIATVLLSGIWQSSLHIVILGVNLALQTIVRDLLLVAITLLSIVITPRQIRVANQFNWQPILEVAKLFIGIFITIVPVLAILRAGHQGQLSPIVALVSNEHGAPITIMYFWLCGVLSGFLDNAPTYLVFFNLAAGDAQILMGPLKATLLAISMGSVFMGALTYIGNAPNFMVRSIAIQNNIAMPSFFGYMKWSILILLPVFLINTVIFFML